MIPKEIALQLVQLKEKSKTYSAIQRSYKIDEIRTDIVQINDEIGDLTRKVDNLLVEGLITNFEIENWFEGLKDKAYFTEINPRIVYDKEQREIERQRRIEEERVKQKQDEIERQKKINKENLKREAEELETQRIQKLEEIERQKKIKEENAKKAAEEHQKRLQEQRIDEFRKICLNKQSEDLVKLHKLIEEGLDVNSINDFDRLTSIIFSIKSLSFIKILVDSGLHITEKNVCELYSKYKYRYNEAKLLDLLISAKNIDPGAIKIVKETVANQKMEELDRQKKNEELRTLNEQKQRIEEFKKMCQYGQENIFKLKELINDGLDITKIADFDCLMSCLECRKPADFIRFLVDSGILVTNKHIKYCYANTKYFTDAPSLINILENAKNIDSKASEDILEKTKFNVIGTISATCICIFLLFMPQILNREIDNFYYILDGIITILFLFISISFIVDLRKRLKINNTNHLLDNQPPHPKQAGYETPNAQSKIGIAGSVKDFNNKEIRSKKMILWIVVTLISVSIIAMIYIYLEEIIAFFKVALILALIIALFIWRYSPTKRR